MSSLASCKGQIYSGSDEFSESHSPKTRQIAEVPRAQIQAARPTLERLIGRDSQREIIRAYRGHGYRLLDVAAHLGVHDAPVSQRLKRLKQASPRPSPPARRAAGGRGEKMGFRDHTALGTLKLTDHVDTVVTRETAAR